MDDKLKGYKIMRLEDGLLCSLASSTHKFPAIIDSEIKMDGKGVWLSTNKDFVIDYYSNPDHDPNEDGFKEVLVTLEFNKKDITQGNINDNEPVITVPKIKILNIKSVLDGEVLNNLEEDLKNLKKVYNKNNPKNNI
jgi:hypothetical protein